jgi:hypothetical protein
MVISLCVDCWRLRCEYGGVVSCDDDVECRCHERCKSSVDASCKATEDVKIGRVKQRPENEISHAKNSATTASPLPAFGLYEQCETENVKEE